MTPRIAVIGAGLIGQKHIQHVAQGAVLHSVVDPCAAGKALAAKYRVNWFPDMADMLAADAPDGIIIATPTPCHVEHAMMAVKAAIPVLVEKPIADDIAAAQRLVAAASAQGVAVLVGHHRRYNPIIRKAKELIESGQLGQLVSVNAMCWFYKPDDYFTTVWRSRKGAGPVLTNLIHDIDLMRFLIGEIVGVQAMLSARTRGHDVEDSAAIALQFGSGVIGTMTVSDTIVAPWSWELSSGENPAYPHTGQPCYMIGGTKGALSLPDLKIWHYQGKPDWHAPLLHRAAGCVTADPLAAQLLHFCDVIAGRAAPLVSGAQGLATLRVVDMIRQAGTRI